MGMDVYGKNGAYFRNNVWWWRPLANYACIVAPEITSKCKYWQSNDGDGLNAKDSIELANALDVELMTGRTMEYAAEYAIRMASIPDEICNLCEGTGVRTDSIGVEHGYVSKVVPEVDNHGRPNPRAGEVGWCNGCGGAGLQRSWETSYPFSEENVKEFVTFLRECGGFEIW